MIVSLKFKFIFAFLITEAIVLSIVFYLNFNTLEDSLSQLNIEKHKSSNTLLTELVKAPMIVYDLATIDNAIKNFSRIKNVISVAVCDTNNLILSSYTKDQTINEEHLKHNNFKGFSNSQYIYYHNKIKTQGELIGHIHFVYTVKDTIKTINDNKSTMYLLAFFSILIGFFVSYFIGDRLVKSLKQLTLIATNIAHNDFSNIEYKSNLKDEVYDLYIQMTIMKNKIFTSNNDLNEYITAINNSAIVSKTDLEGKITSVNPLFCETTGYLKEELIGNSHNIVRDKNSDKSIYKNLWETISNKKVFKGVFKNVCKNGEFFYVDATISPLLDNDGKIKEYIGISFNITDIIEAKEKAQNAKKIKEQFLSNMSHEIRTPLNGILGFISIMTKTTKDEKQLKYLNIIESSSQSLLHVINDILDISKIESGKLVIDEHDFNPKIEIKNTIDLFNISAEQKSINLSLKFSDAFPECLKGDLLRIKQILLNFLSNALKFTTENKNIFVDVSYDYASSYLEISVKDEGIGISQENQEKIFSPFEQADNSTTRQFGGTGLGLSISLKIAELMNGNISLVSELGEGSEFTLSIPLAVCELHPKEISSNDINLSLKGNILIAEDNKTNQTLISLLLEEYELDHTIANDGAEAFEVFKGSKFDLVLMDENMPIMTGVESFKKIRAYEEENNLSPVPVIALTANVMQEDKKKFLNLGMNDFLAKPIDTNELKRVLNTHLKKEN